MIISTLGSRSLSTSLDVSQKTFIYFIQTCQFQINCWIVYHCSTRISSFIGRLYLFHPPLVRVQFFLSHCVSIPSSRLIIPLLPPHFSIQSIRFTSVIYLPSTGISSHGKRHLQNLILTIISSGFKLLILFRQIGKLLWEILMSILIYAASSST